MDKQEPKPETTDIPQKIFTQFVSKLRETDLPIEIIDQLEAVIVNDGNFSEQAIRTAQAKITKL